MFGRDGRRDALAGERKSGRAVEETKARDSRTESRREGTGVEAVLRKEEGGDTSTMAEGHGFVSQVDDAQATTAGAPQLVSRSGIA